MEMGCSIYTLTLMHGLHEASNEHAYAWVRSPHKAAAIDYMSIQMF